MPPEAHLQSDLSYVSLHSPSGASVNMSNCLSNEFSTERLTDKNITFGLSRIGRDDSNIV